jgi:formylglycine-generating enzyme required for sulfatase activity
VKNLLTIGAVVLVLLLTACGPRPFAEGGRALVVGIEHYPGLDRHLSGAAEAARLAGRELAKAGVAVDLLLGEQATAPAILAGMEALAADPSPGPRLFVFRGLLQAHDPPRMSDEILALHAYAETATAPDSLFYPGTILPGQLTDAVAAADRDGDWVILIDNERADHALAVPARVGRWRVLLATAGYGEGALPGGELIRRLAGAPREADTDADGQVTGLELAAFLIGPLDGHVGRTNLDVSGADAWPGRVLWRRGGARVMAPNEAERFVLMRNDERRRGCEFQFASAWPLLAVAAESSPRPDLALTALLGFREARQFCLPDDDPTKALEKRLRQRLANAPDHTANMAPVPAGSVQAGCDPTRRECAADDPPPREAKLPAFLIDRTEVTLGDYLVCAHAGACDQPDRAGNFCVAGRADDPRTPINCVDWTNAVRYCGFVGKRLPTELEWERAARGEDGRAYPWGESFAPGAANWGEHGEQDGYPFLAPVGSLPAGAGPFGVFDMAGNLNEWVADAAPEKWTTDYGGNPLAEPVTARLAKGGGWGAPPPRCTAFARFIAPETAIEGNWGFRCARGPQAE